MSATTLQRNAAPGKPVELGRYTTETGQSRVLVGKRRGGKVAVFDAPLPHGSDRIYVVEPIVESKLELAALVRDYKAEANRFGDCPMRWTFVDRGLAAEAEGLL